MTDTYAVVHVPCKVAVIEDSKAPWCTLSTIVGSNFQPKSLVSSTNLMTPNNVALLALTTLDNSFTEFNRHSDSNVALMKTPDQTTQ